MSPYVCVCFCSHTLLHLSLALSAPLYITGTRHRLHNASPPLCCRGAKQRHPASRNTATDADEEGPVFVYDGQVHRMVCDHVNALNNRNKAGCFVFFPFSLALTLASPNGEDPTAFLGVAAAPSHTSLR